MCIRDSTFPCAFSSIIDYRTCPDNEDPAVFLSNVEKVALEFSHKTVIVLGCGDSYVQLCAHLKDQFPRNVVAPYIDGALLDRLINKEHFYEPVSYTHLSAPPQLSCRSCFSSASRLRAVSYTHLAARPGRRRGPPARW